MMGRLRKSPQLQLLMVMVMVMVIPEAADATITCKAVTSDQQSSVTCYFGLDVFESKHNFNIQFYYPDLEAEPENTLMCNWVTTDETKCKTMKEVMFNNVISDQVTVKGPPMVDRLGGQYVCQVVPTINVPAKPCNLTWSASPLPTPSPEQIMDPEWLEEINERTAKSLTMSTLALVVAILAVVIGVVVVIIFRWRWIAEKIGKIRKGGKGGDEEKDTEAVRQNDSARELLMSQPVSSPSTSAAPPPPKQAPEQREPSVPSTSDESHPPTKKKSFFSRKKREKSSDSVEVETMETTVATAPPPEANTEASAGDTGSGNGKKGKKKSSGKNGKK